jgi:hypothetical protein
MDANLITAVATLIVAIFAFVSSLLTMYALRKESKNYIVDAYFKFQTQFRIIQGRFPVEVNMEDETGARIWKPDKSDKEIIRNIERYWLFVADEWFLCNIQDKRLKPLWDDLYRYGIAGALKIPGFKIGIDNLMCKKNLTMFNCREAFFSEIKRIDKEINNVPNW